MTSYQSKAMNQKGNAPFKNEDIKEKIDGSDILSDKNNHYEGTIQTQETTDNNLNQIRIQNNDNQTKKGFGNREMSFHSNNDLNMSAKGPLSTPKIKYDNVQNTSVHLNTDKYRNEIIAICNNRRESHSQVNRSFRKKELTREYDMNILFLQKREKKINDLRRELLDKEKSKCSFNPMLSSQSKKIIQRSKTYNSFTNCYDRNTQWRRRINRNNSHQFMLEESKQFEECRFYPQKNKAIHDRVVKEVKVQKSDYIYRKNMKWLKDITNRNKEASLEQIQIMMNEQVSNKNRTTQEEEKENKTTDNTRTLRKKKFKNDLFGTLSEPKRVNTQRNNNNEQPGNYIKELKCMIRDLNNIIEKNQQYRQSINLHELPSQSIYKQKKKNYYSTRFGFKTQTSKYYTNTIHNTDQSSNKVYIKNLSYRLNNCKSIQHSYVSQIVKDDLNYKCQLLLQKYYNEKNESINH